MPASSKTQKGSRCSAPAIPKVLEDTRIAPKETRTETFTFDLRAGRRARGGELEPHPLACLL